MGWGSKKYVGGVSGAERGGWWKSEGRESELGPTLRGGRGDMGQRSYWID